MNIGNKALDENEVINLMIKYLKNDGYLIISKANTNEIQTR